MTKIDWKNIKSKVLQFLKGSLKIAIGITLAVIILWLIVVGVKTYKEKRTAEKLKLLAKPIIYPILYISALNNIEVSLYSKWLTGDVYYRLSIIGFSEEIKKAIEPNEPIAPEQTKPSFPSPWTQHAPSTIPKTTDTGFFDINFLDTDEFKVYTLSIPWKRMALKINDAGEIIGLGTYGKFSLSPERYRRFEKIDISWSFK